MQKNLLLLSFIWMFVACNSAKKDSVVNLPDFHKNEVTDDLDEINKQIVENPESPNGFYKRAMYYAQQNDYRKAIEDIDRALKISPDNPVLMYAKAEILFYAGDFETSKIYVTETLKEDPRHVDAMILQGRLLLGIPDIKGAFKNFNEVLKIDPYNADAYFYKGVIFEETEQFFDAISSYHTATEQKSDYYDAYIRLANLYTLNNDRKGLEAISSAIAIKPNSVEAWRNKGLFHLQFKEYKTAFEAFQKTVELDPQFELGYFDMGVVYIQIYDYKPESDTTLRRAIEYFDKAIALYDEYDQAYYNKGLCYEYLKEYNNARESYIKSLEINPDFKPARDGLEILKNKK
ncbi:MAG: tetratricopeptide repeat protein [Flavobacteriales bacterium]